ncbi:ankyrin repeat domain-containing protein [archaeon]|nr:MAG: ankyrin repeat domain-containing protein [archaeon]
MTSRLQAFVKIRTGDLEEVRKLVESNEINLNSSRWSGFTTLHRAAEIGHTDLCLFILQNSELNVNVRSVRGWYTPLHIALANGHLQTAYTLIQNGADPWKKSKYKETCFDYAEKRGFRRLAEEFRVKITREDMKRSIARHVSIHQSAVVQTIANSCEGKETADDIDSVNEDEAES